MAQVTVEQGMYVFKFRYDPGLLAALKAAVPSADRHFDWGRKVWIVHPKYGSTLRRLVIDFLEENISIPHIDEKWKPKIETKTFDVRYIGWTKDRGASMRTASGKVGDDWLLIFPERTLREWFGQPLNPTGETNLYQILCISQSSSEAEIKMAYRKLAKVWHPDVSKEKDATQRFQALQRANAILSDSTARQKYDAGLALQATLTREFTSGRSLPFSGYRSPLTCGRITSEGAERFSRFLVRKILSWEDIVDKDGLVLISSWFMNNIVEVWA